MATQLLIEDRFNCSPKKLFDLLSDDQFDDELMKALKMDKKLIEKADKAEGKMFKIHLTCAEEIPAIAKKFVGEHLSYVETRQWKTASNSNTWSIAPEVKGANVDVKGTTEIVADGNGCIRRTKGTVSVSLPLIGKKIEEMVLQNITDTFKKNADYCRSKLS
ncbi:MAG: DUF2505 domain-containing protein [Proteobacteria bacterium]|nr:DUF2505 domain-containing protein [Pseudomonadota bacterium]